jgi:hypothetical protein
VKTLQNQKPKVCRKAKRNLETQGLVAMRLSLAPILAFLLAGRFFWDFIIFHGHQKPETELAKTAETRNLGLQHRNPEENLPPWRAPLASLISLASLLPLLSLLPLSCPSCLSYLSCLSLSCLSLASLISLASLLPLLPLLSLLPLSCPSCLSLASLISLASCLSCRSL